MKLIDLLREIGETTAKPYPYTKRDESSQYVMYKFETDSGIKYQIIILKQFIGDSDYEEREFAIVFGVYTDPAAVDFEKEVNDPKNLFRVMATVVAATKEAIAEEEAEGTQVTRLLIEPEKRKIKDPQTGKMVKDRGDRRRFNLYMQFIKKQMPAGTEIRFTGDDAIIIELPKK